MYAIIELGSHQYRVEEDANITVFRRDAEEGENMSIDDVLLVSKNGDTQIGAPYVEDTSVEVTVDEHFRGEKVIVYNYKSREGRRKKQGHRDELTRLSIDSINVG